MFKFIKEYKFILSLLVIIGVMSAIAHWDETETKKEELKEASKNKIFSFSFKEVTGIDYINEEEDIKKFSLNLEKGSTPRWRITAQDINEIPDQSLVASFIETLVSLEYKTDLGEVTDEVKLKAYGISDSKVKFKLTVQDKDDISVVLGGSPGVGNGVYLQVNNKNVYICEEFVRQGLTKSFNAFRDRKVIKLDSSKIAGISFLYPNSSFQIEKEASEFKIKGKDTVLDQNLVEDFLFSLNSTLVSSFIDHPETKLLSSMKTSRFLDLFITDDKKREVKLEFSFVEGNVYFKFRGRSTVYVAGADLKNTLTKTEKDFLVKKEKIDLKNLETITPSDKSKVDNDHDHDHDHGHDHSH